MKNIFGCFILILIVGCSSAKQKLPFLGDWYAVHEENAAINEFQFYKDSLVINHELGRSSSKWKVRSNIIHLTHIKGISNKTQWTYYYQLDEVNGLLNLKMFKDDSLVKPFGFMKAENIFDFFQKKYVGFNIDLPITNSELKEIGFVNHLNFNIYAGFNNNNLVVKTDFTPNLNNLENEVNTFKENSRLELKRFLRFNLIADKKISKFQIDSIKKRLKTTSIERIYRTYKVQQEDYKNDLNWFGKKE